MKIFIGQAVTGEDIEKLKQEIIHVYKALEEAGHEHYCTFMEEGEFHEKIPGDKLRHALEIIDKHDTFLAIVRSERRSEGMLMEIGYSFAQGKNIILAIQKKVNNTYLRQIANKVIEYEDQDDLIKQLEKLK